MAGSSSRSDQDETTRIAASNGPGVEIPGFQFQRKLGGGASGVVWQAAQHEPDRQVAIKLLNISGERDREFTHEANLLARLSHPHLVDVYQVGTQGDYHFIVMPYLKGGTLRNRMQRGVLEEADIVRMGRQVAGALDYLHREGLVHRDVKPENILFDQHDNALLADFGITKDAQITGEQTQQGMVAGTPAYMSPEQIRCQPLDGRSDVYSLGAVLYECFEGAPPFTADSTHELLEKHVSERLSPMRRVRDSVARVVEKALEKSPTSRYAHARDLGTALEHTAESNFMDAIKRKTLLRNLAVYVFVSWVILQVIDVVGDIWDVAAATRQSLFILLALGLPVTILGTWLYARMNVSRRKRARTLDAERSIAWEWISRWVPETRRNFVAGLSLLVALVFYLICYFWPDEPLSKDVRRILAASTRVGDSADLVYSLWGFNAPGGESMDAYGRLAIDMYRSLGDHFEIADPLELTVDGRSICRLRQEQCPGLFAGLTALPTVLEANREILQRYDAMSNYRTYSEVISPDFDSPIPPVQPFIWAHHLRMQEIAYEVLHGDPEKGWDTWESEHSRARALLASADILLMKVIAVALLNEQLRLRVLLQAQPEVALIGGQRPLRRLSLPERSAVAALHYELVGVLKAATQSSTQAALADDYESPAQKLFVRYAPYLPNATANTWTAYTTQMSRASLLNPQEFVSWLETFERPKPSLLARFTNTVGVWLMENEDDVFLPYIHRIHDLDQLLVLAMIAERALAKKIGSDEISTWLQSLPLELRDPYTNTLPIWEDNTLSFPEKHPYYDDTRFRHELDLPL